MTTSTTTAPVLAPEKEDLLATLDLHRRFLLHTVQGLTDDQARERTTVSELTLGGLIRHVSITEESWIRFVLGGADAMAPGDSNGEVDRGFSLLPDDTLASVIARYEEVAAHTAEVIAAQPDLSASQPLPEAPWFEPGARWSVRRVLLHLIAETSQHAGHADILRESIDGQKTMG